MGNCCLQSEVEVENRVDGDDRLVPEGKIS